MARASSRALDPAGRAFRRHARPAACRTRPPRQAAPARCWLGGLNAADTSVADIRFVSTQRERPGDRFPESATTRRLCRLGGAAYVFGGGNGPSQLSEIVKVGPAGRTSLVGRLPQPASDVSAAVDRRDRLRRRRVHRRALAEHDPRLEARNAAARGGPAAGRAPLRGRHCRTWQARDRRRLDSERHREPNRALVRSRPRAAPSDRPLPAATTHAAAATLNGIAYVIGGRGSVVGTATGRIFAIDPSTGPSLAPARWPHPFRISPR